VRSYLLAAPPTVQVQEHVQVTAQLPEAVHGGTEGPDVARWEIGADHVPEQGADQEAQACVLLRHLVGFSQSHDLMVYLRGQQRREA